MKEKKQAAWRRYRLGTGENSYASPAAPDSNSFRRLQSLVPSASGKLTREQRKVLFASTGLVGDIGWFHQFDRNNGSGVFTSYFFVAAGAATKLYQYSAGTWVEVTAIGTLSEFPVARNVDNLMHLSNGTASFIFDGTNWVTDGLPIPPNAPTRTVTAGGGTPNKVTANRYYWTTYADHAATRTEHESSSSPISLGTGTVANTGTVDVFQEAGTVTTSTASPVVTSSGTNVTTRWIGMKLYTNGQLQGTILSVNVSTLDITLTANAATNTAGVRFVVAPARATHWHIYASASEEDKQGKLLAEVVVTTVSYTDSSFMIGLGTNTFTNIERPLRNDPTNATKVMELHKRRLWRRRETYLNTFTISGYGEILEGGAGSPFESVPGADLANTVSPSSNSDILPDESDEIRCMVKHGDAIYVGSEDETIPWIGSDIDEFEPSENSVFSVGMSGRYAGASTPHGLVFRSYDHKIYLYPSRYTPSDNATSLLIEIGRPIREKLKDVSGLNLYNAGVVYYNWGDRDWLVHWWKKADLTYATWVFDFDIQGWFELQQGYSAVGVFEISIGKKILVAGDPSDDKVYVIDDQTGTYAGSGNFAAGTLRELVDFNEPNTDFVFDFVEYELSNPNMEVVLTVYRDPNDPENPTNGEELTASLTRAGANRYRASFGQNALAQRVLVELVVSASTENGDIRGLSVYAEAQSSQGIK